ncbi:MAG TPA: CBS domain-containing protein [Streptosporangiaceae bacterium]|jgi:CBS domain-containing protein|nr:CBS domain-containing protein [Streptosporangiaceae bacterium]
MATAPGTPAVTRPGRTIHLSELLKRPITDSRGESLGRVEDVVVQLPGAPLPVVKGLVAKVGGREVFIPVEQTGVFDGEELKLTSPRVDLRRFERRDGEVLLRADVLGHRLIDVPSAHLVRAADLELRQHAAPGGREEWVLAGVDVSRRPAPMLRLFGRGGRPPDGPAFRDWSRFEPLIGHAGSARLRGPLARIRRLKPAQIADLLEDASKAEETEILGHVHADPELEADVFEELDEDEATRLLTERSDAEIAAVLARMRADDAADTVAELPQHRRQAVLDLLPPPQRTKVLTLMGFNQASAGGLMGVDFLTLADDVAVADALAAVGQAESLQPEALTSVHAVDTSGRLHGVVTVVRLVQADSATPLLDVCDLDPVRVGADTDVVDVAVLMSDYNLITVPVVDEDRRMIGLITVDDVLEATLPDDWRRRETAQPPDAHRGTPP